MIPSSCCLLLPPTRDAPGTYAMTGARSDLTRDVRPAGGEEKYVADVSRLARVRGDEVRSTDGPRPDGVPGA